MAVMAVRERIKVPKLWVLFPCLIERPESWVTAQKKLSLACEMAIAPAPIANTVNTFIVSESKPRLTKRGAMIEAVVIMATVDEPWAVFREKAIKKGRNIPQLAPLILALTKRRFPNFGAFSKTSSTVIKITGAAI